MGTWAEGAQHTQETTAHQGEVGETWASSEELGEMLYDFLSGQSADSLTASSSQP